MFLFKRLPQRLLTLSVAYSRASSDHPPAPSLSFSLSGSPVKLYDALTIHCTFAAMIPIY
jgi:hypothetical protein